MKYFLITSIIFNFIFASFSFYFFGCLQQEEKNYNFWAKEREEKIDFLYSSIDKLIEENRSLGGRFKYD